MSRSDGSLPDSADMTAHQRVGQNMPVSPPGRFSQSLEIFVPLLWIDNSKLSVYETRDDVVYDTWQVIACVARHLPGIVV